VKTLDLLNGGTTFWLGGLGPPGSKGLAAAGSGNEGGRRFNNGDHFFMGGSPKNGPTARPKKGLARKVFFFGRGKPQKGATTQAKKKKNWCFLGGGDRPFHLPRTKTKHCSCGRYFGDAAAIGPNGGLAAGPRGGGASGGGTDTKSNHRRGLVRENASLPRTAAAPRRRQTNHPPPRALAFDRQTPPGLLRSQKKISAQM